MGPAYRIVTERTVVRCYDPGDAGLMEAAVSDNLQHLRDMPWIGDEPLSLDARIALLRRFRAAFDSDEDFPYGIFDPSETELLGSCGLHPRVGACAREIGYWIRRTHEGQGLVTEVAGALTRVAFEVDGVERVEVRCAPDNERSAAVPRRLGFSHEVTLRRRVLARDGQLRDSMVWTLFLDDYPRSPAATQRVRAFDAAGRPLL
jgi:RimJ/RimL family protein N-acetyltransferase